MPHAAQPASSEQPAEGRVADWEQRTEWPLTAVAVLFLVVYAWPILQPDLSASVHETCHIVDYATWLVFAVDYVTRVALARNRRHYVSRHIPDLAVVALPVFRPLRLLRVVLLLRVLNRQAASSFRGRVIVYVSGSALVLILCSALAVLDAERGRPHANIATFGNAVWWAFTTVSTVGYGDHFPVTVEGRCVAVGLMIGGVALIGVVTATFASWLIDRVRDVEDDRDPQITLIHEEVQQLRGDIAALHAALNEAVVRAAS